MDGLSFNSISLMNYKKKRIIKTYPDNYQEHLDKMNHISEQNLYLFPDGYPHLSLHVDESNEKQNLHEVNLLLMRN